MKKIAKCRKFKCDELPFLGGLCKQHHEEDHFEKDKRKNALTLLHENRIDGVFPVTPEVIEELKKLQKWWHVSCCAVNFSQKNTVLQDEASYAVEWCIGIASELVTLERSFLSDTPFDVETSRYYRESFWERFDNLEKGLMSNGYPRTVKR